jgi:predicted outer membrane repeat protein
MHHKLLRAVAKTAVIGGIATLGLGSAQTALATTSVPVGCTTSDLTSAMGSPTGSTLDLAQGCTYVLTSTLTPTALSDTLTIVGHHSTIRRSRVGGTASFTILTVGDEGNLALKGVNVSNGGGSSTADGGAISNGGTVTIYGGIFSDNHSETEGGAIYSDGTLTVHDTLFTKNGSDDGGAVYVADGDAAVDSSTFRDNTAEYGGAIDNKGDLTIGHSGLDLNNASDQGGALYTDGTLAVEDGAIIGNTADAGGAIYKDGGTVTLTGTVILVNVPDNCEPAITGCPVVPFFLFF